eukprot:1461285-Pyramimonas_sp.AAC.1
MSAYCARGAAFLAQPNRSSHLHEAPRCARRHVPHVRSAPPPLRHAMRISPVGRSPLPRDRHAYTCCSTNDDRDTVVTERWDRAQLLASQTSNGLEYVSPECPRFGCRQLEIAIAEEDYAEAARFVSISIDSRQTLHAHMRNVVRDLLS